MNSVVLGLFLLILKIIFTNTCTWYKILEVPPPCPATWSLPQTTAITLCPKALCVFCVFRNVRAPYRSAACRADALGAVRSVQHFGAGGAGCLARTLSFNIQRYEKATPVCTAFCIYLQPNPWDKHPAVELPGHTSPRLFNCSSHRVSESPLSQPPSVCQASFAFPWEYGEASLHEVYFCFSGAIYTLCLFFCRPYLLTAKCFQEINSCVVETSSLSRLCPFCHTKFLM